MRFLISVFLIAACIVGFGCCASARADQARPIETFPKTIDTNCGDKRARIFDECGDQEILFSIAQQKAREDGKVLLVSLGAEWCIWCHVFDKYVQGDVGRFEYDLEGDKLALQEKNITDSVHMDAQALNAFVAENFVLLHLESEFAPGAYEVLEKTGALTHIGDEIPFVFVVDSKGRFARIVDTEKVEVRADGIFYIYRGYDRPSLLQELKEAAVAAR